MPVIDIRRDHRGSIEDAKKAVETAMDAMGRKFGIHHQWHGDRVEFFRIGVKGHIAIMADAIHVRAELGFLLAGLKQAIENEIEGYLDRAFDRR